MAAFNGTSYVKGTQVLVLTGENEGLAGTIIVVGLNGNYVVQIGLDGERVSLHHSQLDAGDAGFGHACSACGAAFHENDERAEVVNKTTGARSVMHVEEYLADTDCYDLA